MKKSVAYILSLLLLLPFTASLPAEEESELKLPHKFQAGQPAKASEVNENFDALKEANQNNSTLRLKFNEQSLQRAADTEALNRAIEQLQQENSNLKTKFDEQTAQMTTNFEALNAAIEQLQQEKQRLGAKLDEQAALFELLPKTIWGLDEQWRPLAYATNDFEAQGEVVLDWATGLMWQQAGSTRELSLKDAQGYIASLNEENFGSYNDWRLPTIPELLTLVSPDKHPNDLYLDPLFDKTQRWCLSANRDSSSGMNWSIGFIDKTVYRDQDYRNDYVRAVRSFQISKDTIIKKSAIASTEPSAPTQTLPIVSLRSEPRTVSSEDAKQEFGLTDDWTPQQYIDNQFNAQGEVVLDHATGLMWQQSGSENYIKYADALKYVEELNRRKFAGYDDWRLPTIPELMSLLEPEKQSNGLYIDPVFDKKQSWCWSADTGSAGSAWLVRFLLGFVNLDDVEYTRYVRCVRS